MNYDSLIHRVDHYPLFGDDILTIYGENAEKVHLQLARWAKTGKVIPLKRGLYTLPEERRKIHFSLRWLANTLYSPSYISLEYALAFYDLIPERVTAITSVTRNKTALFENRLGRFVYRHLQPNIFFGFEEVSDEYQKKILMALPEKALFDYIYLYSGWEPTPTFMEENIRLQNLESLSKRRLKEFVKRCRSPKMELACTAILEMF